MNKKFMPPIVLFLICSVIGVLMAVVNGITAPIIEDNQTKQQNTAFMAFYSNMDHYEESNIELVENINAKYDIYDSSNTLLGNVYRASGSNSYGEITMLVAVNDDKIIGVSYLTNEQTKNPDVIETVGTGYVGGSVSQSYTDTISGVTVGSKLVNKLMNAVKTQILNEGGNN